MKYALVTGGSRGLGRAVCLKLAAQGLPVIINYQSNQAAAEAVKAEIEAAGGTAELMPFNVGKEEDVDRAFEAWTEAHPDDYISILVNNAGITRDGLVMRMSEYISYFSKKALRFFSLMSSLKSSRS